MSNKNFSSRFDKKLIVQRKQENTINTTYQDVCGIWCEISVLDSKSAPYLAQNTNTTNYQVVTRLNRLIKIADVVALAGSLANITSVMHDEIDHLITTLIVERRNS